MAACGYQICSQRRLQQARHAQRPPASTLLAAPSCRHRQHCHSQGRHVVARAEAEAEIKGTEGQGQNMEAVKDIDKIMSQLPHRYPFLLVDRVVDFKDGEYAVGYKNVTINDQFFNGHFPGRPIMPGVLQVEAMAQLGGLLMLPEEGPAGEFFFGGVDGVKWRKPVVPGDVLMMRVEVTKFNKRYGMCKMSGKCFVGEDVVCQADMTLIMAKS